MTEAGAVLRGRPLFLVGHRASVVRDAETASATGPSRLTITPAVRGG
jgi:hypothetical protein